MDIRNLGGEAKVDVDVMALFVAVDGSLGRPDGLVNAAGVVVSAVSLEPHLQV